MTRDFKEIDPKLNKILDILTKTGFKYSFYSDSNIKIVDNSMTCTDETGEIGSITVSKGGEVTFTLTGSKNKGKIKTLMKANKRIFKAGQALLEVGAESRILIKKYKDAVKELAKEL